MDRSSVGPLKIPLLFYLLLGCFTLYLVFSCCVALCFGRLGLRKMTPGKKKYFGWCVSFPRRHEKTPGDGPETTPHRKTKTKRHLELSSVDRPLPTRFSTDGVCVREQSLTEQTSDLQVLSYISKACGSGPSFSPLPGVERRGGRRGEVGEVLA